MTHLEQFNEEVMKEFDKKFPVEIHGLKLEWKWIPTRLELEDFITQKLTEQKALILEMVREKVPMIYRGGGKYCFECEDYIDGGNSCMCLEFNRRNQEFLNNLDTI